MNGILLIDKPAGWTSHDVVAKVRGLLRQELSIENRELSIDQNSQFPTPSSRGSKVRVGHTGTLDPFATGLLVLVLGSYTKRAGEFSKLDKIYEAELTLGATSTTGDIEGEISPYHITQGTKTNRSDVFVPKIDEVQSVLGRFLGVIEQVPPQYSAVKVGGQRAYALARKGKKVVIEPRRVTINRLQITEYQYPKLKIITEVSSGTYIRSLAEHIGEKLGTGAYLSALRRTRVGPYSVADAQNISTSGLANVEQHLAN